MVRVGGGAIVLFEQWLRQARRRGVKETKRTVSECDIINDLYFQLTPARNRNTVYTVSWTAWHSTSLTKGTSDNAQPRWTLNMKSYRRLPWRCAPSRVRSSGAL